VSRKHSTMSRIWSLLCSLKLAISLASLATLLMVFGSLQMHANPALYGNLDQLSLRSWVAQLPDGSGALTWWLVAAGICLLLFGLNTLCCLIDWAIDIRGRWRKTGEYLIHLGFILFVVAFIWGSSSGIRNDSQQIFLGERMPLSGLPGHELIVDAVEPVLTPQGRPLDMLNQIRLMRGEVLLAAEQIRINHPLIYRNLVVVPVSFGQQVQGFECFMPGHGQIRLVQGARIELGNGKMIRVLAFYADAAGSPEGQVRRRGSQLRNPAMLLELTGPGLETWRGWYFLRDQLPYQLVAKGVRFWPVNPLFTTFTVLTINYDPGADLALVGGCFMLLGTMITLFSFYRKRRANERPEV